MSLYTVLELPAVVGMQSLVGVSGSPPYSFGNYFSINNPDSSGIQSLDKYRVWNFWAENLKAAVPLFLLDGKVRVRYYEWVNKNNLRLSGVVIDDPRIPNDWYYPKMCFTGSWTPPIEIAQDIYALHGDPSNELEKWTDEDAYYKKRGYEVRRVPGGDYSILVSKV